MGTKENIWYHKTGGPTKILIRLNSLRIGRFYWSCIYNIGRRFCGNEWILYNKIKLNKFLY